MEGVKLRVNCICVSNPSAMNKAPFRPSVISYAEFVKLCLFGFSGEEKKKIMADLKNHYSSFGSLVLKW